MAESGMGTAVRTESLTSLHYAAMLLAAVTGVVHLYEGIEDRGEGVMGILFVLAGLGFFGAIVLPLLGYRSRPLYFVAIGYTGVQIVAFFALRWPEVWDALGLFDKAVQLALVVVLAALYLSGK